ncbi:Avirulence (Avh) protein [Phytophthora megakarya]|uniref:Avirulence (Avh) protein n=1 Tax=Phytophthora megakarya TaxID=4795 RepID=A0A225VHM0_9STRA|nr:Avirulence (Avh) protein [Phytophthora megakarya]
MKLNYFVLLVFVIFASSVVAASAMNRSKPVLLERSLRLTPLKESTKTLESWAKNNKSPEAVLTRLKLSNGGDDLLQNRHLSTWVTYMTLLDKTNIQLRYTDEVLPNMILAAKKVSSAEDIATKLQNSQVQTWKSADTAPDDLFNLLQLNKAGNKFFGSPEFPLWVKYVNRGEVETISSTLSSHYMIAVLAQLLVAAKQISGTENIATKLQVEQLRT